MMVYILKIAVWWTLIWASEIQPRSVSAQTNLTNSRMATCLQNRGSKPKSILFSKDANSDTYNKLNFQWNTRYGNIQPVAILAPNTPADISNAVVCAKLLGIHVVTKSGGHSYEKYSFGNNETVVIDLINLNRINVDQPSRTALVGGGAILAHIYSTIWGNGKLGMAAGSCVTLGAGHTLGAGYGYLSKRLGMTLDNVLELEFVDANGDVRVANPTTNSDLFWAFRGAGAGNFGIVTRLKYQLFDLGNVTFTKISLHYTNASMFSQVFQAWDSWNAANQKGSAYTKIAVTSDALSVTIIDSGFTRSDLEELKLYFPTAQETAVKSLNFIEVVSDESSPSVPVNQLSFVRREDQPSSAYRAKSYFSNKTCSPFEVSLLSKVLTRVPEQTFVQFSSFGGAINRVPVDATAFVHRNSLYNIQVGMYGEATQELAGWLQEFDQTALRILDNGESYQNYNDGTLVNYLDRYYGLNLPRLLHIKRKEDPSNFFRFPQSISVVWTRSTVV